MQRQTAYTQHRHATDAFEAQAAEQDLKTIRDDLEIHEFLLTQNGEAGEFITREVQIAHEHYINVLAADDDAQLIVFAGDVNAFSWRDASKAPWRRHHSGYFKRVAR